VKHSSTIFLFALAAGMFAGCGDGAGGEDPAAAYDKLVKSAASKDYGHLYDALDGDMRRGFDTLIAMTYRSRASMAPDEKAFWDTAGKKSPREAFIDVMGRDPMYTASLTGPYRFVKADTLVVVSIERNGTSELRYFSPENGQLKVTSPPLPEPGSTTQLPPGHPSPGEMPQTPGGSGPGIPEPPNGPNPEGSGDPPPGGTDTGR
jgi:hypothetical protein